MLAVKCQKCRHLLANIESDHISNSHGTAKNTMETVCKSVEDNFELYLHEDTLVDWIKAEIEKFQWTKGKLKCPKCGARVGSFDFISGQQCFCTGFVLPPVHLIRSKVDVIGEESKIKS